MKYLAKTLMDFSMVRSMVQTELSGYENHLLLDRGTEPELEQVAKDVSRQIREVLARYRAGSAKQDDGSRHWAMYYDSPNQPLDRGVIGIPTRGCSYARTEWAGCSVCGHNSSTLWNSRIRENEILADFRRSLKQISEFRPPTLCLYTSGSFLDNSEISFATCQAILSEVADLGWIKNVCIESLPHFVTPERLNPLVREFPSLSFSIAMGLDSTDKFVRYFCFQRATPLSRYKTAIQNCSDRGIQTVAYVVHKPPFLTVDESVADTALSIQGAFELGFSLVSVEPVTLQAGTLQLFLNALGLYELPTIWSIASAIAAYGRAAEGNDQHFHQLRLGGQVFTPLPHRILSSCTKCLAVIRNHLKPLSDNFFNGLPLTTAGECCRAQQLRMGGERDAEVVLVRANSIISKARLFLTGS